jgi:hypothetical protein
MKVPEGAMLGDLVSFANARVLNFVGRTMWKGKFVSEIECHGNASFTILMQSTVVWIRVSIFIVVE